MAVLVYQILFVPACNGGLAGWAGRFDFLLPWRVHGDVLFVVWVDGLTVTQIWEGASKKCLVVLSKFYYARIKIIRILRYCFIYILLPDICRA
jgi:hypothetical protein